MITLDNTKTYAIFKPSNKLVSVVDIENSKTILLFDLEGKLYGTAYETGIIRIKL